MKIDIYTKFIMTLMAIGLLLIGAKGFIAPAVAESDKPTWQISTDKGNMVSYITAVNQHTGEIKRWQIDFNGIHFDRTWSVYDN